MVCLMLNGTSALYSISSLVNLMIRSYLYFFFPRLSATTKCIIIYAVLLKIVIIVGLLLHLNCTGNIFNIISSCSIIARSNWMCSSPNEMTHHAVSRETRDCAGRGPARGRVRVQVCSLIRCSHRINI